MATTYTVRRGETLSLYLEAVSGDPTTVSSIVAKMKPLPVSSDADTIDVPATFQSTSPGSGILPGWYVTISATMSAGLKTGTYALDAAFVVGVGHYGTELINIVVTDSVSLT